MSFDSRPIVAEIPAADSFASDAAPAWAADIAVPAGTDLWVFAYGSLMWNPGFPFAEQQPAFLRGYHRRFCVWSSRYRGTPERPGLVLGLEHGGSCRGIAYRVEARHVPAALDYLWEREMVSRVYRPKMLTVRLGDCEGARVPACTFVADRRHRQYCGCLCVQDMAARIAFSVGERGSNLDYLANTVSHLEQLGIRDHGLTVLLKEARRHVA